MNRIWAVIHRTTFQRHPKKTKEGACPKRAAKSAGEDDDPELTERTIDSDIEIHFIGADARLYSYKCFLGSLDAC